MGLETAFEALCVQLDSSHEYFREVRLTVTDAEEGPDTKALVGGLAQELEDLIGDLEQARHFGELARRELRHRPPSIDEIGRCLSQIQDLYWKASRRFADEIVSHFMVDQVHDLARRNPRFAPWSETVIKGLEGGRASMHDTAKALHSCWNEALDRALLGGAAGYAVRTANRDSGNPP